MFPAYCALGWQKIEKRNPAKWHATADNLRTNCQYIWIKYEAYKIFLPWTMMRYSIHPSSYNTKLPYNAREEWVRASWTFPAEGHKYALWIKHSSHYESDDKAMILYHAGAINDKSKEYEDIHMNRWWNAKREKKKIGTASSSAKDKSFLAKPMDLLLASLWTLKHSVAFVRIDLLWSQWKLNKIHVPSSRYIFKCSCV